MQSKKVTVRSYIVLYSILRIVQYTWHLTPWQICSIKHHLTVSEKHHCSLIAANVNYWAKIIYIQISTTGQVVIYTAEWTGKI